MTTEYDGTVVSTRKYDVYGAVRGSTGPSGTRHQYVGALGHASDPETGYIYMRARYYDPITGRFASEDHARHGLNWFVYASNAPTSRFDETGSEDRRDGPSNDPVADMWDIFGKIIEWSNPISKIIEKAAETAADQLNKGPNEGGEGGSIGGDEPGAAEFHAILVHLVYTSIIAAAVGVAVMRGAGFTARMNVVRMKTHLATGMLFAVFGVL